MGKGSSSSETNQSSSTTDARVGADNGAVVIQEGASQNISFSPEVAQLAGGIVENITDFSRGVVSTAGEVLQKSIETQEAQTNALLNFGKTALAASPATPQAASAGIISNQNLSALSTPLILLAAGVMLYFVFKK
jgi:hypothetical protein